MVILGELVGASPAIVVLREQVDRLLRQIGQRRPPPVLIQGETGTGKGLLASGLQRAGPRAGHPLIAINCATIPEALLESELFGFERGAFTDARHAKPGLFHTAHGGTLLLDEVALLSLPIQAKLLTVIEERMARRLGRTQSEPADVWVIAATNSDLEAATRQGAFREDLYHRLAVLTLTLPPLRERGEDVILLAERFLARAAADYGRPAMTLGEDARDALRTHAWPGNVRELANVIERAVLLEEARHVTASMLRLPVPSSPIGVAEEPAGQNPPSLESSVRALERSRLVEALRHTGWNVSRTAERLGITRNQVRYRIERHGLRPPADARRRGRRATVVPEPPGRSDARPVEPTTWAARWEPRLVAFVCVTLGRSAGRRDFLDPLGVMASHVAKLHGFEGVVEEVSPTQVVVAFGVHPTEDAPSRAAWAALAVQRAADRSASADATASEAKAAVHVTHALVGYPIGAPRVDLESRRAAVEVLEALLARAAAGTIVVSPAAAPFLARRFELTRLDPPSLGIADGSPFVLAGPERSGFGLGGRALSPFVGRIREREAINALLTRVEQSRGQVLGLVGDPGVGKSRVVFELTRSDRLRGWRVLGATAVPHGSATPYLPILDLLRVYFEVDEAGPRAELRDRVAEKVRALGSGLQAHLGALLGLLELGPGDSPGAGLDERRQRLEAIKRLLLRESQAQPLLVIVEDLHWSDTETRAALETLLESLAAARILLLVTFRPGFRQDWGRKSYYTQLRLDPLTPQDTVELLRQLLGGDASLRPVARLAAARAEGNAFFLEETVRLLVETGAVAGGPGAYRLTGPVQAIKVPETVQALLAARIDRLPSADRRLLQSAAVIGRDVPLGLLEAVAGAGAGGVLAAGLRRLQSAEFLYEVTVGSEPGHTFKHALTHEVAYESLPPAERRALHGRVVEVIERRYADDLADHTEQLAYHASRGQLWSRAIVAWQQAGHRAMDRHAFEEAAAAFEQALSALEQVPPTRQTVELAIDLRFELRNVLQPMSDDARNLKHLQVAERLASGLGDRARLGRVLVYQSTLLWLAGEAERAVTLATTALEIGESLGDAALEVMARIHLGAPYHALGEYRRAAALLEPAIALSGGERLHERLGLANIASVQSRRWLVCSLAELGVFEDGVRRGEEAVRIADSAGHLFSQVGARLAVGSLHLARGDPGGAVAILEEATELERRGHKSGWLPEVRAALGYAYVLVGRPAEGLPLLETDTTERTGRARRVGWLAEAYLLAGRTDQAKATADRALALAREHHERGHEAWAFHLQGEIASSDVDGRMATAEEAYRLAMGLAHALEMRPLLAHCHLGLGRVLRGLGRAAAARRELEGSLALFRSMGMSAWAARAEGELAASAAGPPP